MEYTYSYSGADTLPVFHINSTNIVMKDMVSLNVSVMEAKEEVRGMGQFNVRGFTGIVRTVVGTMVFSTLKEHPLTPLYKATKSVEIRMEDGLPEGAYEVLQSDFFSLDMTERGYRTSNNPNYLIRSIGTLPKFDISLYYIPEYPVERGQLDSLSNFYAKDELKGVSLFLTGKSISTSDMNIEYQYQFKALDYWPLAQYGGTTNEGREVYIKDEMSHKTSQALTGQYNTIIQQILADDWTARNS